MEFKFANTYPLEVKQEFNLTNDDPAIISPPKCEPLSAGEAVDIRS